MKLVLLMIDLWVSFFCFAVAVRLFNHVGYMINVPLSMGHAAISPERVAAELNRAGWCYGIGMRTYYVFVPLTLWLFGPQFMVAATVTVLMVMFAADRKPKFVDKVMSCEPAEVAAVPILMMTQNNKFARGNK